MTRVYISYRPSDASIVSRIVTRCRQTFGPHSAVFDPERSLLPDRSLEMHLEDLMHSVDYALIVIGPDWSGIDEYGRFRLSEADIPVAQEVSSALSSNAKVFPVLVRGITGMPPPDQVPEHMHDLYGCEAVVLREDMLEQDLNRLIPPPSLRRRLMYWLSLDWLEPPLGGEESL